MKDFLLETGDVIGAQIILGLIAISNLSDTLKLISIILAIGYTLWKWQHDYYTAKRESKKTKDPKESKKK